MSVISGGAVDGEAAKYLEKVTRNALVICRTMGPGTHVVEIGCVGDGGETTRYVKDMWRALSLKVRNLL